jgi:glycosyltransferase involved in cell wall biosynthesis
VIPRVTHCPVNTAGIPWSNVEALRRRGLDARLVVFERYRLHPEADWDLARRGGFLRQQATQWAALARLLPQTDVFHFYFGLTLVPKSLQFPILRATGRKSVLHFLGSDWRGKPPEALAYAAQADARVVGSVAALEAIPDAELIPPGLDLRPFTPAPPSDRERPLVLHAPSNRVRKGTERVIAACAELPVDLEIVEGVPHEEARERYRAADIVVDQLNAGWHGVFALESMALGKPVVCNVRPEWVERAERRYGLQVPIVPATKETLVDALRPLVDSPARRREVGAASRAYVERVHDVDRVADRLVELYERI